MSCAFKNGSQVGDVLNLFFWLRGQGHSPVAEFTLDQDANGDWLAVNLHVTDVTPSVQQALLQQDTLPSTQFAISVPGRGIALKVTSGAEPAPRISDDRNTISWSQEGDSDVAHEDIFTVL